MCVAICDDMEPWGDKETHDPGRILRRIMQKLTQPLLDITPLRKPPDCPGERIRHCPEYCAKRERRTARIRRGADEMERHGVDHASDRSVGDDCHRSPLSISLVPKIATAATASAPKSQSTPSTRRPHFSARVVPTTMDMVSRSRRRIVSGFA